MDGGGSGDWEEGVNKSQSFSPVHLIDKGGFDGRDSPDASLNVALRSCSCLQ